MSSDPRFYLLTRIAKILCPDYPLKWPELDWVHHPEFKAYLTRFDEASGHNAERRWMMQQLLRLTDGVPGDTAECGAYIGAGSYLICRANAGRRMHHIFDSFEGLSAPAAEDGNYWRGGDLAAPEAAVDSNLEPFSGHYRLYKGWIPGRFSDVADKMFSFVHIDVDLQQPTYDSIEFFYPRLSPGGILVCDDFGLSSCPGATAAITTYLGDRPEKMIELASGGGFLIKGAPTSAPFDGNGPRGVANERPSPGRIGMQLSKLAATLPFRAARTILRQRTR